MTRALLAILCVLLVAYAATARNPRGSARPAATGTCASGPATVPGTWVNISPAGSNYTTTYGIAAMEIDPNNTAVLYAAADQNGLWKSTNCGTSWTLLGTPPAVAASPGNSYTTPYLDSPIAIRVDPSDSTHLVATQGVRGTSLGFWVSHNGGATWTMPTAFYTLAGSTTTNDVTQMAIDPTNFNHIIVGSHSTWVGLGNAGVMETTDGGTTWTAHAPVMSWSSGSLAINFLYDPATGQGNSQTWLVGDWTSNGMWKTTNSGGSWTQVTTYSGSHGGGSLNYTPSGTVYAGSTPYPVFSNDNGNTWAQVNGSGLANSYYYVVTGDGTTLYTMESSPIIGGYITTCFLVTPESTGTTSAWTSYQSCAQTFNNGPFFMKYDPSNRIMYSASWGAGLLALKVL